MEKPVLVIMAAGMGSRYGGLKQIDPVDEQGNIIIDFSIYDAVKAGFEKIVFVIKHQIEEEFKRSIGERIAKYVQVEYVFQELDNLVLNQVFFQIIFLVEYYLIIDFELFGKMNLLF